ncbi:Uu.00g037870.m01.CDS01 [Anthostomella pinea]|uniref:Uu.00g037870.m01.CDS01 n=1 Tax=Anthostomella pinea TaxID=933095 RepID=A0AAI8V9K6_9PEZI|nr:Uu.00g037870.m01.CDS01 [Anthostomella pinea]
MARPKKVRNGTTVEAAPSHDSSPTYAAYDNLAEGENRPLFALRVYDTTTQPAAASDDHVRYAAKVVGLPMTADVTDDERAQRCREDQIAEVAARKSAGLQDWFLPGTYMTDSHLFGIHVITRLERGFITWWEEAIHSTDPLKRFLPEKLEDKKTYPFGTHLSVVWGVGEHVEIDPEDGEEPSPGMEVSLNRIIYLDLGLSWRRHRMEWFYNQYVADGGLDQEFESLPRASLL